MQNYQKTSTNLQIMIFIRNLIQIINIDISTKDTAERLPNLSINIKFNGMENFMNYYLINHCNLAISL